MKFKSTASLALMMGLFGIGAANSGDGLLDRIAVSILSDRFGVDAQGIYQLRRQTELPVYDLAPIYEGAQYFNRSPSSVWQLRNQGMGWGQIAQRIGMQPGTFNKLRRQGAFDRDQFWAASYRDRFDTPDERIRWMRRKGGSLEDMLGAIVVGKLARRDPGTVYDQYEANGSWARVASASNVRFEDWRRVSAPVRSRINVPVSAAKVKVNSKGRREMDDDKGLRGNIRPDAKGRVKYKGDGNGKRGNIRPDAKGQSQSKGSKGKR